MKNTKKIIAGLLAVIAAVPAVTFYASASFQFRMAERYIADNTADNTEYKVKASIRSQGGYVETVNGSLVVVSQTNGEMRMAYQITDKIKNIEELNNTRWGFYLTLDGLDNFTLKENNSKNIMAMDNRIGVFFNESTQYSDSYIMYAYFKAKDTTKNITLTTEDGQSITVYKDKSYKQLSLENKLLSEQADRDAEYIEKLEKEVDNLQNKVDLLGVAINSNEGLAYDVDGDGYITMKDAMSVMMFINNHACDIANGTQ